MILFASGDDRDYISQACPRGVVVICNVARKEKRKRRVKGGLNRGEVRRGHGWSPEETGRRARTRRCCAGLGIELVRGMTGMSVPLYNMQQHWQRRMAFPGFPVWSNVTYVKYNLGEYVAYFKHIAGPY